MDPSLGALIAGCGYPGRGLVLAHSGQSWRVAYFLTGRSEASRGRVILRTPVGISVAPRELAGNDPLRHYRALAVTPRFCVVGNGDQVDAIASRVEQDGPLSAVQGIEHEPDPPLRTPRISLVCPRDGREAALVTRAFASTADPGRSVVGAWTVGGLQAGHVMVTTTYRSRGDVVVQTSQAPVEGTATTGGLDELAREVWDALPATLRVGVVAADMGAEDPVGSAFLIQ